MSGYYEQQGDILGNAKREPLSQLLSGGPYLDEVCTTLGTLREILDLPRGSVYVVQGAREVLIPDRPEFVCSIDPAAGRMVVHLIEGM